MSERREFQMTDEQHEAIMEACKPVPYLVVGGRPPASPQENANRAWARLGQELGFRPFTVQPVRGKSDRFFSAVPVEDET